MINAILKLLLLGLYSILYWVAAFTLFIIIRYNGLPKELSIYTDEDLGIPIVDFYTYALVFGFLIGIFYAITEFLFDEFLSKKLILGVSIVIKSFIYLVLIIITLSFLLIQFEEEIDIDLPNDRGWWQTAPFFWNTVIYFVTTSIVFSLVRIVIDKFGKGLFLNILLGKYRKPREETRVLMFLDLKDSTKIAEKLGHISYSNFIQDCFTDLNSVLNKHDAEVYQYVGDEAVVTWTQKKGFKSNNCINLYFAFKAQLSKHHQYYTSKFGFQPVFKAGVHFGELMIAEVGTVKKEIAYHGDVINTAARIQSLCNTYDASLLVSEMVLQNIRQQALYKIESKGDIQLKGKEMSVAIFSVSK